MKTVTEILIEARELISDPERWTQGVYARDAQGIFTDWDSPEAVSWCVTGAIAKVVRSVQESKGDYNALVMSALDKLRCAIGHDGVTAFNDAHNHAEVLAAFDKAIEASRNTVH